MSVPWPVRWRSEQNQIQNICHQLANIIINDENTYNNLCRDWHHEGVILAVANGYVDQYVQTHYVAGEINPGYALLIRESLMRLLGRHFVERERSWVFKAKRLAWWLAEYGGLTALGALAKLAVDAIWKSYTRKYLPESQ